MNKGAFLQYQSHPSCPILWTLGEANQISSFRSEKLPCYRRPEADSDESSAESGVRLRLPTTPRDLSPSPPLCLDDNLSSLASRWPFVCDDLSIFGPSSPGWTSHSCCPLLIIAWRQCEVNLLPPKRWRQQQKSQQPVAKTLAKFQF